MEFARADKIQGHSSASVSSPSYFGASATTLARRRTGRCGRSTHASSAPRGRRIERRRRVKPACAPSSAIRHAPHDGSITEASTSYTDHRHIEFVTLSAVHSTRWSPGEPRRPPPPGRTPQPIRRRQCATMFAPCVRPRRESSTSSSPYERPDARGTRSKEGKEGREGGREGEGRKRRCRHGRKTEGTTDEEE